jgi:hypothetical protein
MSRVYSKTGNCTSYSGYLLNGGFGCHANSSEKEDGSMKPPSGYLRRWQYHLEASDPGNERTTMKQVVKAIESAV